MKADRYTECRQEIFGDDLCSEYKPTWLIGWIGGKQRLRETIAQHIPNDIGSYIEPFGGAGWVLFYKEKWAKAEVYNDINGDLVNLFRVVKASPQKLIEQFEYNLASRELFNYYKKEFVPADDIQKAVRFVYLLVYSYSKKMGAYGYRRGREGEVRTIDGFIERVKIIHERLKTVNIEHDDYSAILNRYDESHAFFYLDPPYYDYCSSLKREVYKEINHVELSERLKTIKGKFLLSYNDCPEIREIYKDYNKIEVERQNSLTTSKPNSKNKRYHELLIMNY